MNFTINQLINLAQMTHKDLKLINQCRRHRIVLEYGLEDNGINLQLMEHINPITWDNVILYGEYILNQRVIEI